MKLRPTQFGMREDTASPRQHASRLAVDTRLKPISSEEENPQTSEFSSPNGPLPIGISKPLHAASVHAATGEGNGESRQLLTVHEVAQLLHVPTSWVYERTRRRSNGKLPHVKLGKYLRFEEATITEFIQRQRCA
jgi:excisionase family DNA binding protein